MEKKAYKIEEEKEVKAQEPAASYYTAGNLHDYISNIPQELLHRCINQAIEDVENGRTISHPEADALIKSRLGWK